MNPCVCRQTNKTCPYVTGHYIVKTYGIQASGTGREKENKEKKLYTCVSGFYGIACWLEMVGGV